jgi:nucleotide-binding universal stress UspA family protein
VIAVHAWQVPPPVPSLGGAPGLEMVDITPQLKESAEKLAQAVVAEVVGDAADVNVQPVAVEGPAANVLIDAAEGADVLVVGSRGHGGFVSLLLGSVSQQVAAHAPCPVLIHRRPE